MRRLATILLAVATAAVAAGCGDFGDHDRGQSARGSDHATVLTRGAALPEGHPPLNRHGRALPDGHPPVAGYGHGLPAGHPVCPAGRQMIERAEPGDLGAGPPLIST